jgi:hypothetical protein
MGGGSYDAVDTIDVQAPSSSRYYDYNLLVAY